MTAYLFCTVNIFVLSSMPCMICIHDSLFVRIAAPYPRLHYVNVSKITCRKKNVCAYYLHTCKHHFHKNEAPVCTVQQCCVAFLPFIKKSPCRWVLAVRFLKPSIWINTCWWTLCFCISEQMHIWNIRANHRTEALRCLLAFVDRF